MVAFFNPLIVDSDLVGETSNALSFEVFTDVVHLKDAFASQVDGFTLIIGNVLSRNDISQGANCRCQSLRLTWVFQNVGNVFYEEINHASLFELGAVLLA